MGFEQVLFRGPDCNVLSVVFHALTLYLSGPGSRCHCMGWYAVAGAGRQAPCNTPVRR